MTKMSKKNVSNEQLARLIAKGFEGVDNRFNNLESKMATKDDLAELKTELKQDIEDVDLKISRLAYDFDVKDLKKRMTIVERKVGIK